jgi:hypothetical protein
MKDVQAGDHDSSRPRLILLESFLDEAAHAGRAPRRVADAVADISSSPPLVVRVVGDPDAGVRAPTEVLLVRDALERMSRDRDLLGADAVGRVVHLLQLLTIVAVSGCVVLLLV